MLPNFLDECKITRVANAAVAGTDDIDSARVDMTGFDSVCFIALLGDATSGSVLELKVMQNTADSASSPSPTEVTDDDVQYTAGASDADNKLMVMAVRRPNPANGKYLFARLVIDTQNCVVDGIIAIQYNSRSTPITQGSTVLASDFRSVR